jgi:hypothetical protein
MTHDERAKLIKRIFMPLLVAAIVAGVWFYPKPGAKAAAEKPITTSPENGLLIILHRLPGDPASDQMAEILNRIQTKYDKQIIVSEVDAKLHPEVSKTQGAIRTPHVVIISGKEQVFDFQGLWTQAQVEYKVEEILRGLKRVGKDWRPPVPGMTPAGK